MLPLSGLGVYLGRYERWNSWEVPTEPTKGAAGLGVDRILRGELVADRTDLVAGELERRSRRNAADGAQVVHSSVAGGEVEGERRPGVEARGYAGVAREDEAKRRGQHADDGVDQAGRHPHDGARQLWRDLMAETAAPPRPAEVAPEAGYDQDFVLWTERQAALIRAGQFDLVDWENVATEIEAMGSRERRELGSRLKVLVMHLLKWQFQPERRSISWRTTINDQRDELEQLLADDPSLRREIDSAVNRDGQVNVHLNQASVLPLVPVVTAPRFARDVLDRERLGWRKGEMLERAGAARIDRGAEYRVHAIARNQEPVTKDCVSLREGATTRQKRGEPLEYEFEVRL